MFCQTFFMIKCISKSLRLNKARVSFDPKASGICTGHYENLVVLTSNDGQELANETVDLYLKDSVQKW